MAFPLTSLMVLLAVHYGTSMCQAAVMAPVEDGCANKTGYIRGAEACCGNYVYASLYKICCVDPVDSVCYCDGVQFGQMCAEDPAPPTDAPFPPTLCPGTPVGPSSRMLTGKQVDNACSARGVVGLSLNGQQFCNGAFIRHADALSSEKVLYTLTTCWDSVNAALNNSVSTSGVIFNDEFPIDECTVTDSAPTANQNVVKLSLSKLASYFVEQHVADCPSPGCLYSSATMSSHVNLQDCFIVSYGLTALLPGSNELTRVKVQTADVTQCQEPLFGTQCFVSTEGGASCFGDDGAPVYCSLSTGEVALYGIASPAKGCLPEKNSFNVYPIMQ